MGGSGVRRTSRVQLTVTAIFLLAVLASAVLGRSGGDAYRFLIGDLDPLLVTSTVATLGALALRTLVAVGWFDLATPSGRIGWVAPALGAALTVPVILVDLAGGFPADMNVPFPESLLFYPSIALVAESALHLVPLALVAVLWRRTTDDVHRTRLVAMGVAALIEPVLQVAWGSDTSPAWANAYVGFHLLVFNVAALAIFRRSGFIAFYGFRLGYYLVWHVTWGYLRLPLLFQHGT